MPKLANQDGKRFQVRKDVRFWLVMNRPDRPFHRSKLWIVVDTHDNDTVISQHDRMKSATSYAAQLEAKSPEPGTMEKVSFRTVRARY